MDREVKRQLIAACKVDRPVGPEDPRYVDFDALDLRGPPWRQALAGVVECASEPASLLATGQPGSGISTELRHLELALREEGYQAFRVAAGDWIRGDQPIRTSDLLLAMTIALIPREGDERRGAWTREYGARVNEFLLTTGGKISETLFTAGFNVGAELSRSDILFQTMSQHLASVRGMRDQVFKLLEEASDLSRREDGGELVLILDGVERRATGELCARDERGKYRDAWLTTLQCEARDLRPPVHVVYTVPAFTVRRAPQLAAQFGQELLFLPTVRALRRSQQRVSFYLPGVHALCDMLCRRVPPERFDGPEVAVWLAAHSGGYLRDLLRLARACVYLTPEGGRISRKIAEIAVERIRASYVNGLETEDEYLLERLHRDGELLIDEKSTDRIDSLIQRHLILTYHEGAEWFGVHPLLWRRLKLDAITWEKAEAMTV